MKRLLAVAAALLVAAVAIVVYSLLPPEETPKTPTPGAPGAAGEIPIRVTGSEAMQASMAKLAMAPALLTERVAVVPVLGPEQSQPDVDHLTLAEALEAKVLTVSEVSEDGSVPQLKFVSTADKVIFVPMGSIVTGGKQDRMLAEDLLLSPHSEKIVRVFCVEQGRWAAATGGNNFNTSKSVGVMNLRRAVRAASSQREIWDSVAKSNAALGNTSGSDNYQGNLETEAFKTARKQLDDLEKQLGGQPRCRGLAVLIDGKVVSVEIFGSNDYFKRMLPQILDSLGVQLAAEKPAGEPAPVDAQKARQMALDYLARSLTSLKTSGTNEGANVFQGQSNDAVSDLLEDAKTRTPVYFRSLRSEEKIEKKPTD